MEASSTTERPSRREEAPRHRPAISVRGLTKRFGRVTAVDDLTLEVHPGVVTGFLGPNGAGKSTTLRIDPGPGVADRGFGDRARDAVPEPARPFADRRSGARDAELQPADGAAGTTCGSWRRRRGSSSDGSTRFSSWSAWTLPPGATPGRTRSVCASGSGSARALLGDPRILILDEPANGLDPQGIRWLRDLLRVFAAEGNAVLVSSHVLAEVAQLADEAIVINRGRLVRQAPIAELTSGSRRLNVVTSEVARLESALRDRGLGVERTGNGGLQVSGADAARVGTIAFETGVPVLGLAEQGSSLEDAFLELTEEEAR